MSRPTVLVVDDFEPMAIAVSGWLSRWYDVVGCVHRLTDVVDAAERLRPQVVVLDLAFKLENSLAVLPALMSSPHPTKVVIHTAYREQVALEEAIRAGASGFVVKASDFGELQRAVETVLGGGRHFPSLSRADVPRRTKRAPESTITPPWPDAPTTEEAAILRLLAQGRSARQVGAIVGLHHSSIRSLLEACWLRLGMEGPLHREQLVAWYRASRDEP